MEKNTIISVISFFFYATVFAQTTFNKSNNEIEMSYKGNNISFLPEFTILYNPKNPELALKAADIKNVSYNVLTWKPMNNSLADFRQKKVGADVGGDGLDDRMIRGKSELRTANLYHSGENIVLKAIASNIHGDTVIYTFPTNLKFALKAWALISKKPYPVMYFSFTTNSPGYYSIGYTGAPSFNKKEVSEIFQPLIWTEKIIPDIPYLTPAFMATLPTTLINAGNKTVGVSASPEYIPFQPLPLLENSQFGVAMLNASDKLQTQLFAPILGGRNSYMKQGTVFNFSFDLINEPLSLTNAYEQIARKQFGFTNYRHNSIASMNTVIDNLIDYVKTHYAWFVDSLKGFAYSTDVPGAVKNVSSLNPLEMAIVMDDSAMFEKRAYPLMEFMLSREKFLFSLDSNQKIQSPSRKLEGPVASISELEALYNIFGKQNSFYPQMAKSEFSGNRTRNLDDSENGYTWINAMFLFKLSGDSSYLNLSKKLANKYLKERVDVRMKNFGEDSLNKSLFFWTSFTNHWEELLELYELTKDTAYLQAAHDGARHYALFEWMVPSIPDGLITVNKDGKAPWYKYLKSKGFPQMHYPEENAPAWRLSEIGLTPEASGTSASHRGIFMSNFAPWMLRIGYYTKDSFLIELAKASLVGRSRSFPGYHMNTARTTAYEKTDFPLHEFDQQSITSFHYNHILPMASLFMDYLISDALVRSKGEISFPDEYIEGYAYLQNKFYGNKKGKFYDVQDAQLWMPSRLLKIQNVELNYVAARKNDTLLLAFMNQSSKPVRTIVTLNNHWVEVSKNVAVNYLNKNGNTDKIKDSSFNLFVPANGITSVAIYSVNIHSDFQQKILATIKDNSKDFISISAGNAKAMLFKLGEYKRRLFLYLQDDDNTWKKAELHYTDAEGKNQSIKKLSYPFEFTVDVDIKKPIQFSLTLTRKDNTIKKSPTYELGE